MKPSRAEFCITRDFQNPILTFPTHSIFTLSNLFVFQSFSIPEFSSFFHLIWLQRPTKLRLIFDRELDRGHMNSSYFWRQASISYIIYWNFLTSQFSYDMRISLSWQIRLLITIYQRNPFLACGYRTLYLRQLCLRSFF